MKLIAIDWETLATTPSAAVIAIGAVVFDLHGDGVKDQPTFFKIISTKDQESRQISMDTLEWWEHQSQEAKNMSFNAPEHLRRPAKEVVKDLVEWITKQESDGLVGNGSTFDNAILSNLCENYDLEYPVKFWQDFDLRTMKLMANTDRLPWPEDFLPHHALDDAIYEAMCAQHYWKTLHEKQNSA